MTEEELAKFLEENWGNLIDVVFGEPSDDCPLCKATGVEKKQFSA
jgi:hypothetical protein